MPRHPYMQVERANRGTRGGETMRHFREAVLAEAEQFVRALDQRMSIVAPSRRTYQHQTMKATVL